MDLRFLKTSVNVETVSCYYYYFVCVLIPVCNTIVQVLILVGCSVLLLGGTARLDVRGIGQGGETYDTQEGSHS